MTVGGIGLEEGEGKSDGRNRIARSGQDRLEESQRIGRQAWMTRATPSVVVAAMIGSNTSGGVHGRLYTSERRHPVLCDDTKKIAWPILSSLLGKKIFFFTPLSVPFSFLPASSVSASRRPT